MLKLYNLKLFFVLIIIFPILSSLFFIYKERLYVYTYLIDPISSDQIEDAATLVSNNLILEFKEQAFKDREGSSYKIKIFDKAHLEKEALIIYSPIVRFLQNNKSYRELYIKEKNLSKNQKKKLNKIVNNISVEGAYFLNPKFIDKVKMKFYSNSNKDENNILLFNYIDFIISKELEDLDTKGLTFKYSNYLKDLNKSLSEDKSKIYNHLERMILYKTFLNSIKLSPVYTNKFILKEWGKFSMVEIEDTVDLINKIIEGNYTTAELSKLEVDLPRFLETPAISQDLISYSYFMKDGVSPDFNTSNFINNLTLSKTFRNFENFFRKNEFHINTETLNIKLFEKMIRKNFVKVEMKLNYQEYFSNLLFSFVMALVSYLIILNFLKKNS